MSFPKLFLAITLPLYVVDQITKFWTVNHLSPYDGQGIVIAEGFFKWIRVHNQGVAFGFGNGSAWAPIVFLFVPIIAISAIAFFWKRGAFHLLISKIAVALLISGIFGNLTDRLVQGFRLPEMQGASFWSKLSAGYVVDFISIKLPFYDKIVPASGGWWPTFNVADSCICTAACLLFIGGLYEETKKKKAGLA
ncbi:signal peptidase II [Luteolibacter pohnpeiensis]|uniref:Lipoprotein signal peptidase n=1 Tax=Luteolibacter pohnpeiensis TaxID=454153 RepID=A0A934S6F1_9BACT|nr:signal peptidase II [Luteolibacter pohnpeiensis]MBK1883082.1 signal peptidase II [Luteolibacter pohnpeiensis]